MFTRKRRRASTFVESFGVYLTHYQSRRFVRLCFSNLTKECRSNSLIRTFLLSFSRFVPKRRR